MTSSSFFFVFFSNLYVFLTFMTLTTVALYLSVRRVVPAGYLDPLHFYWTFTFGTAYGIVISLYFLGFIESYLFYIVVFYGVLFIVSFRFFLKLPRNRMRKVFSLFLIPKGNGYFEFLCVLIIYVLLLLLIIWFVGFGMFAESNRFEQNRGFGALVRGADALRLFVIAYLVLIVFRNYKKKGRVNFFLCIFVALLMILGAVVNGAKFALLEAIYSGVLAIAIYHNKLRFKIVHAVSIFGFIFVFALLVLSMNLDKNDFNRDAEPSYIVGDSVLLERIFLRILGNADKYFLSLPNNVIEELETDSVFVRFISPLVGTTRLSSILGYNVNNYNVGKQILLYYDPDYDLAGGPTSHFDLFSYKYFGLGFGWLWVLFTAFLLSSILLLTRSGKGQIFYSALVAALWLRSLPILLEPTVGFAYMIDIFILFFLIKTFAMLLPRKGVLSSGVS